MKAGCHVMDTATRLQLDVSHGQWLMLLASRITARWQAYTTNLKRFLLVPCRRVSLGLGSFGTEMDSIGLTAPHLTTFTG